jgi:hypothetical protein
MADITNLLEASLRQNGYAENAKVKDVQNATILEKCMMKVFKS